MSALHLLYQVQVILTISVTMISSRSDRLCSCPERRFTAVITLTVKAPKVQGNAFVVIEVIINQGHLWSSPQVQNLKFIHHQSCGQQQSWSIC